MDTKQAEIEKMQLTMMQEMYQRIVKMDNDIMALNAKIGELTRQLNLQQDKTNPELSPEGIFNEPTNDSLSSRFK